MFAFANDLEDAMGDSHTELIFMIFFIDSCFRQDHKDNNSPAVYWDWIRGDFAKISVRIECMIVASDVF